MEAANPLIFDRTLAAVWVANLPIFEHLWSLLFGLLIHRFLSTFGRCCVGC